MNKQRVFLVALPLIFLAALPALADYTLILKNGRQIAVQNYREEGRMIKFHGLGGEIGLSKDLIATIVKSGTVAEQKTEVFDVGKRKVPSEEPVITPSRTEPSPKDDQRSESISAEGERQREEALDSSANEEADYRRRLAENAADLKRATDEYIALSRGGSSTISPSVPTTEQEIAARTDDLLSRIKDEQSRQAGHRFEPALEVPKPASLSGAPPSLLVPGEVSRVPTVNAAPSAYTEGQKGLSNLRNQVFQLETERVKLLEEMKQRNFEPGSLQ